MKPTRYFSRDEASAYLRDRGFRIAKQTLAKYAVTGGGLTYRNFGTRVVYDPSDLDEWVKAKLTAPRRSRPNSQRSGQTVSRLCAKPRKVLMAPFLTGLS